MVAELRLQVQEQTQEPEGLTRIAGNGTAVPTWNRYVGTSASTGRRCVVFWWYPLLATRSRPCGFLVWKY
eukprot:3032494-Amphidinium_carterae.1